MSIAPLKKPYRCRISPAGALVLVLGLIGSVAAVPISPVSAYGQLPLSFEPNRGQAAPEVRFLSRSSGYQLFLTAREAVLTLPKPTLKATREKGRARPPLQAESAVVRMRLQGANPNAVISGQAPLPGKVNYLRGQDPMQWRTDIPTYEKVKYMGIYPGIDLVYYGRERQLEYDFIVAPGADPQAIALTFSGGDLQLTETGDLMLATAVGDVCFQKPVLYQKIQGHKRSVEGRYVRRGEEQIGFEIGAYDTTRPLVIDPVLSYSTYLGGEGSNWGADIAVDRWGQAYVVGETLSDSFPTTVGSLQSVYGGNHDAFVAKINGAGTALVYATYLGGSDSEWGRGGIAVDRYGQAFVTGNTYSDDFPTTPEALQRVRSGGSDTFVAKLNAAGNALVYATYLGGSRNEWGHDIAIDSHGGAYVTGYTESEDFPTIPESVQPAHGGGMPDEFGEVPADAFVAKLNAAGSELVYSTYLGGSGSDWGSSLAVDLHGQAYVTGSTWSDDFPTQNSLQPDPAGSLDIFVAKLNDAGSGLVYATYLGGSGFEQGNGIAVDPAGQAYVTGYTESEDFPTLRSLQPRLRGDSDAFVAKFNTSGTALVYATYFGGNLSEGGRDIAVDSQGRVAVAGYTASEDLPLRNPLQSTHSGGFMDAFVTRINAAGRALIYSTYLGGSRWDEANGVAMDFRGQVYVVGETTSDDFPLRNALQPVGGRVDGLVVNLDAFVTKISHPLPFWPWRH